MNVRANTDRLSSAPLRAGARQWWGLVILLLPALLVSMDVSILFIAAPAISQDLGPTATQWLWMLDVYSFVVAALLVTMGSLADRIGRRRLLMIGALAFGLASLALALAPTPGLFILGRILLAIGAATLAPSTLALVRAIFLDPGQRSTAVAAWTVAFAGGSVAGPVLGGVLLANFAWPSVFLVNLPVMALLLVAAPLLLPESRAEKAHFDIPGALLSLASLFGIIYSLKDLAEHGVRVQSTLILLLGLTLLGSFIARQRHAAHPLIDLTLFLRGAFTGAIVSNVLVALAMTGLGALAFTYMQAVYEMTALEAALHALPTFLGSVVGAWVASRLISRLQPGVVLAGGLLTGSAAMTFLGITMGAESIWVFIGGYVGVTVGVGVVSTVANSLVLSSAPSERTGVAASVSETALQLGSALGIAGFGTVAAIAYRSTMPGHAPQAPPAAQDSITGAQSVAADLPPDQAHELLVAAREAYTSAFGAVTFAAAGILMAAAILTGFLLRTVPVEGRQENH